MLLVVKLPGQQLAAASVASPSHQDRLFYVRDCSSSLRFLVDTGAEVSVVPPSRAERCLASPGKFRLQAINGSDIATFGVRSLTLDLGLRRTFRWVFVIADISQPILISCTILVCSLTFDIVRSLTPRHTCGSMALHVQISPHPQDLHVPSRTTPTPFLSYSPSSRQ